MIDHDLPIEAYHEMLDISNSGLNDFARSPHHFYSLHLDPERPERRVKAGQLEGTLAHCAILEPTEFAARFDTYGDVNRNTKEWKAFAEKCEGAGKTPIQMSQHDVAWSQAASVRALPDVAALLKGGAAEVSAFWTDADTGVECRCRPDYVANAGDGVILLDLKTYSDASPAEFARQVARKGYHRQAAFYSDGYAAASRKQVLGFVFVAVETEWPYAASACMLDDESLAAGRRQYRELLTRYSACRAANVWPGYSSTIESISLPAWAMN